jgi:hypothetical protein
MPGSDHIRLVDLDHAPGERLALAAYRSDFQQRQWTIAGQDSWKLERGQSFQEPGFESWEAFSLGHWDEALRLIEGERDYLRDFSAQNAARGIDLFRVRVVEKPLSAYLHWELHLLRLRAEYGEKIRVVGPEAISGLESAQRLPEILTLGEVIYRIQYTEQGVLDGAVRFIDPQVAADWGDFIRNLYDTGEDLSAYFDREVRHLPPPE